MFGVSFSELGLIFVVALIVLGPARLPGLVRKVGRWVGKARSMARDFQQQLENEINLDELNRLTETRAKESKFEPPEAPATPAAEQTTEQPATEPGATAEADSSQPPGGGYPYGPQEPPYVPPAPTDDTYSHAHAQGELPMDHEPAEQVADEKRDSGAA